MAAGQSGKVFLSSHSPSFIVDEMAVIHTCYVIICSVNSITKTIEK